MRPQNNIRFFLHPCLDGLEVSIAVANPHAFPNHTHDHFTVVVMEKDGCYSQGPRRTSSFVRAGQLCLINPGQVHSGVPPPGSMPSYRNFYVSPEWMRDLATETCGRDVGIPEFARLIVSQPEVGRALQHLSRLLQHGGDRLEMESCMIEALTHLLTRHGNAPARLAKAGREHRAMRLVQEHLADRVGEKVALEELAALAGLSRYHLLRVFKRDTGLTPHAFHTQMRVDRARILVRQGLPFADVAAATGFVDQSHFTTTFRQFTGATPGQYAALHGADAGQGRQP